MTNYSLATNKLQALGLIYLVVLHPINRDKKNVDNLTLSTDEVLALPGR